MSESVVVVDAVRSPFGRFGGALRVASLPSLASATTRTLLERAGVEATAIDEFVLGVNFPGSDRSVARQSALRSGIPDDRNAHTVDRACCSSLTAMRLARRSLQLGEAKLAVAGGVENLSRVPYFLEDMRWGKRLGNVSVVDQLVVSCPMTGTPRAVQASEEAAEHAVGRDEQDEWALRSQQRYAAAKLAGHFAEEAPPVDLGDEGALAEDESPRARLSIEDLRKLATIYGSATVTAGNAPGLSTGSSAALMTTKAHAVDLGLPVLAEILVSEAASGPPQRIASIPAVAARRALDRCGIGIDDVDLIEINEAFAAVPLVSTLLLGAGDAGRVRAVREKTNVNGGAIAVGHPTGATGTRLVMTAANELRRRGGGIGLVTICGGIGEAEAVILRV